MSKLDFSDPEIKKTIDQILSNKPDSIDWALFSYVPKSDNKIKVVTSGKEGWDELLEEINEGKVQYYYIRFPVGTLFKYVLIGYLGEGVTGMLKGSYQNHSTDFLNYLKTIKAPMHVNVNARSESDLDLSKIQEKLRGAMGANYDAGAKHQGAGGGSVKSTKEGVNIQVKASEEASKIVTSTGRALPTVTERDKFWNSTNQEQDKSKTQHNAPVINEDEKKKFWDQTNKDTTSNKTNKSNTVIDEEEKKKFWEQQQQQEEKKSGTHKPQVEVTTGASTLKSVFEQKAAAQAPPPSKPAPAGKKWTPPPASAAPPSKPAPLHSGPPKSNPPPPVPSGGPPGSHPPSNPPPVVSAPPPSYGAPPPLPYKQPEHEPEDDWGEDNSSSNPPPPSYSAPPPLPYKQPEPEPEDDWGEDNDSSNPPPPSYGAPPPLPSGGPPALPSGGPPALPSGGPPALPSGGPPRIPPKPASYPVVTAVYPFVAEQPTDLSFNEGDQIEVLDSNDPSGWWKGRDIYGNEGVFPMNHVTPIPE